ncbi:MAG: Na+/H+ antiporter subunit E [Pseudomonadota bacterium]
MINVIVLVAELVVLWLLLSGYFKGLLLTLGAISILLVLVIAHRMKIIRFQQERRFISPIAFFTYVAWLIVEIAKTALSVTKLLISPKMPIRQRLIRIPVTQKTDIGKTIYANSITLTPGTVTVETEGDTFLVHALTDQSADRDGLADMDGRVTALEQIRAN